MKEPSAAHRAYFAAHASRELNRAGLHSAHKMCLRHVSSLESNVFLSQARCWRAGSFKSWVVAGNHRLFGSRNPNLICQRAHRTLALFNARKLKLLRFVKFDSAEFIRIPTRERKLEPAHF